MALFSGSSALNKLTNAFSFLKRKKEDPQQNSGGIASGPQQNYTPAFSGFGGGTSRGSGASASYAQKPPTYTPPAQPNYLQGIRDRSQQRIDLQNKATEGLVGNIRKAGQAGVSALQNQIPALQGTFDKFTQGVRGGLERSKTATLAAQENARNTYGGVLRQGAEGFRQLKGGIDKKFANLNAIDSSAYQNRYINANTKFAGQQQGLLGQQAQEITRLDSEYAQAEIDAEQLISMEESNLQQVIAQIQGSIAQGTIEYEQAISDAYNNAQSNIYNIQDQLATFENEIALAKQEAELEGAGSSPGQDNKNQALGLIDFILSEGNIPAIAGGYRPGNIPLLNKIGGGGDTATAWNSIKDLLALAARGQLKGTGTVSDFEAEMLQKAAVAGLDPTRQTEEEFERGLRQLQADLQSGGAVVPQQQASSVGNYADALRQAGFSEQEIQEYLGGN